jgi:hypothetical protein
MSHRMLLLLTCLCSFLVSISFLLPILLLLLFLGQVLLQGVCHAEESVRVDCLEAAAVAAKPTDVPSDLELQV